MSFRLSRRVTVALGETAVRRFRDRVRIAAHLRSVKARKGLLLYPKVPALCGFVLLRFIPEFVQEKWVFGHVRKEHPCLNRLELGAAFNVGQMER